MLQKPSSGVLASLKASTYRKEYASASHSLRPRWAAFLNILIVVSFFVVFLEQVPKRASYTYFTNLLASRPPSLLLGPSF